MSDTKKIFATLVRGSIHIYAGKTFEQGKPVEVTAKEKAHMEVHAVDSMMAGGEEIAFPKFKFTDSPDPDEGKVGEPRRRSRA